MNDSPSTGAVTSAANTVLVIAHEWDPVATQAVDMLATNGIDVVRTTPSALCGGAVTYISVQGTTMWASTVPQLERGGERTISSTELGAVFNRAVHLDPTGFADEDDESYAACERAALYSAMIEALDCEVLNRAQGTTLSGPPHLEAEWMATAVRGGLAVRAMSWTSDGIDLESMRRELGSVTVVGDRVVADSHGGAPTEWAAVFHDRARALTAALGCRLLRIELGETVGGRCVITRIDPRPMSLEPSVVFEVARHLAERLTPTTLPEPAGRADLEHAS